MIPAEELVGEIEVDNNDTRQGYWEWVDHRRNWAIQDAAEATP